MAQTCYRVTQMEPAGPIHQLGRAETSLYYPILGPSLACFLSWCSPGYFSKEIRPLSPGKNVFLVTQATSTISPDTFPLHGMNFWLKLWTVRTAGFSNSFCHWFLHEPVRKLDTPLCLSFSFYDGATNSPPTVVFVKITTFTSPPECYWKAQEKEIDVDTCTIQAAPPSRPQLCGNHCL